MAASGKRPRNARDAGWQRVRPGRVGLVDHPAPRGARHEALRVAREARGLDDEGRAIVRDGVGQEADDRLAFRHHPEREEPLPQKEPTEAGRIFRRHARGRLLPGGIGRERPVETHL